MDESKNTTRCGRRWKKGRGSTSKARIGPRRKIYGQGKKKEEQEKPVSPSDWPITIPCDWIKVPHDAELRLCQISWPDLPDISPPAVICSLHVKVDLLWVLHVHGHYVDPKEVEVLGNIPSLLNATTTDQLLQLISGLHICIGNPDPKFVDLAKSKKQHRFLSTNKEVVAYLETGYSDQYASTVRTSSCHLLSTEVRCSVCKRYRSVLIAMSFRWEKHNKISRTPVRKTNYRYLKTPERLTALRKARKTLRAKDQKVMRLKGRLDALTSVKGVEVDQNVTEELEEIIKENSSEIEALPATDFRRVFWSQQVAAMKKKDGMRWHPLFIRWCLNLSRVSPKAYEIMKESGIRMPTRRTLNDYTHFVDVKAGFSHEVDVFLRNEARVDELNDWQRFVVIILDEMKIQEDLVFDKTGHQLLGFVNLGDVNSELKALETQVHVNDNTNTTPSENIATHVLTLMIRGIFIKFEFPYASFPTQGVTGQCIYWIFWEAVRRLEEMNLKVIGLVCDGAKPNRKFIKSLGIEKDMKNGMVYKTVNRYCHDRYIYFICDVPHLMKTTRNCWLSSTIGGTRCLWRNGKHILWEHIKTLYNETQAKSGLFVGRRLSYEHIHLTSFSKMKVNLAAQVLSSSVSLAFKLLDKNDYEETAHFCYMFDKFFDCLNTRDAKEGKRKRKPDLDPYRSVDDVRFKWLEEEFLGYLDSWQKDVMKRNGFTQEEKKRMLLSQETIDGLHITVYSFVEMAKFLLSQSKGLFLLSERLNQDPLESFFGKQRARGGRSDNPNIRTFLYNSQAIRVQRTMAIGHGGNVRKKREQWTTDMDDLCRPLKKRRR